MKISVVIPSMLVTALAECCRAVRRVHTINVVDDNSSSNSLGDMDASSVPPVICKLPDIRPG